MKIYFTYCSNKKRELGNKKIKFFPEELYLSPRIQNFIKKCKKRNLEWAIFSDKYGLWFPKQKHESYDKHPDEVTEKELKQLIDDSFLKLKGYDSAYFYIERKGRFSKLHKVYKKLFESLKEKGLDIYLVDNLGE